MTQQALTVCLFASAHSAWNHTRPRWYTRSRIIDNAFENWTRTATKLLGTVTLRCDYSVPVGDLRDEAKRFIEGHQR